MFVFPFLFGGPVGYATSCICKCTGVRDFSKTSNKKNVQIAHSKIDKIIHKKDEKKFFTELSIIITESPYHFASAMGPNLSGKSAILISPSLIQADEQAAGFILKHELGHIKYRDYMMAELVPLICSLITSICTLSTIHPIPATGVTYLSAALSRIAYSRFYETRADDFACQYSTAEELEGGKRFLLSARHRLPHQDLDHPTITNRLEKVERSLYEKVNKNTKRIRKKHAEKRMDRLSGAMATTDSSMGLKNANKWEQMGALCLKCLFPSQSLPILVEKLYLCKKSVKKRMDRPTSIFSSCKTAKRTGDFHKRYVFLKQIGQGNHSTVYLAKDYQNELFAIKKYKITDQIFLNAFSETAYKKAGITEESYIKSLAEMEKEVGRLTDHPHLMKIREVHLEGTVAYVVTEHIEGNVFDKNQTYSLETRTAFTQQFLSAMEHLLSKNIYPTDLHTGKLMVSSENTRLTLIDFGSYEIVNSHVKPTVKVNLTVNEYLSNVSYIMRLIDKDKSGTLLEKCKHLVPEASRRDVIASTHLPILLTWLSALQKELLN